MLRFIYNLTSPNLLMTGLNKTIYISSKISHKFDGERPNTDFIPDFLKKNEPSNWLSGGTD